MYIIGQQEGSEGLAIGADAEKRRRSKKFFGKNAIKIEGGILGGVCKFSFANFPGTFPRYGAHQNRDGERREERG